MVKLSKLMGKNPIDIYEDYRQEKLSRESFLLIISSAICLGGLVHGFLVTQSQLLLLHPTSSSSSSTISPSSDNKEDRVDFQTKFISLYYLGEAVGALLSFPFIDELGRRNTLLAISFLAVLLLAGSIASLTSSSSSYSSYLLSARFALGCVMGGMMNSAAVYLSEIVPATSRGQAINLLSFLFSLGSLLAILLYALGVEWHVTLLLPMATLFLQIVTVSHLPESPRWLLAKKTPTDCSQALRVFRRSTETSREFSDIYRGLSMDARLSDTLYDLFSTPTTIRLRCLLSLCLVWMQQWTGIHLINLFVSPLLLLALIMLAGLTGSAIAGRVMDKTGRRALLLMGSLAMVITWFLASSSIRVEIEEYQTTRRLTTSQSILTALFVIDTTGLPSDSGGGGGGGGGGSGSSNVTFPILVDDLPDINTAGYSRITALIHHFLYPVNHIFFTFLLSALSFIYFLSLGGIGWIYPAEIFPYRARAKLNAIITSAHYLAAVLSSSYLSQLFHSCLEYDNGNSSSYNSSYGSSYGSGSSSGWNNTTEEIAFFISQQLV
eukprot:gene10560-11699_t